jgi:glycosyltransferase involved in cell wall biosynthesis
MRYEKPWMSDTEISTITKYLNKNDIMLEWGSGGSTNYFPQFVDRYYSIEHDKNWYNEISGGVPTNVIFNLVQVDENLTDPTQKHQVKTYIDFVDTLGVLKFDKVLIDGRGRGWCAEKIVPYLHEDSIVFIHDYWQRPQYHVVERWFDVIDYVKDGQSLVVLKMKKHLLQNNKESMKISIIQPSRNNLKYLKWSYDSIRKNQGNHLVEICVADDFSNDGTWEWCLSKMKEDSNFKAIRNNGPSRIGHTILYDKLINEVATHDICMIYHADMYLCPNALDEIQKYIGDKKIVSLTRIEPPLHPDGPEKVLSDWGTEPEDFNEDNFLNWFSSSFVPKNEQPTSGVFAPWAFMKSDFQEIGGHDKLFAPQSKEDSDIFNRFQLNGVQFIQTWGGYVYHMTCRGSRFNPTLTTPGTNSKEWEEQNLRSTRNFIRKWGHFVKHDEYMKPIIPSKYNIGFVVKNCTLTSLSYLELFCDSIYTDTTESEISKYISDEQKNTTFNLSERIFHVNEFERGTPQTDIVVYVDAGKLQNGSQELEIIQNLSQILDSEELEVGSYELGSLKVVVNIIKTYEKELIFIKNK